MSDKSRISLAAYVSRNEREAVELAAGHIARALGQASAATWTCDCIFCPDLETLHQRSDSAIIVTSLLPELENISLPWPQIDQRLRAAYIALCEPGKPVFICTILRHVGQDEAPETTDALMIRIRRLNLLAAEISRETGAFVIDLDRVLADIGSRRLQTNYRLEGKATAEIYGQFIAETVIANALDAYASFEIQDAAVALLAASRTMITTSLTGLEQSSLRQNRVSVGQGRRKQIITPVTHTVDDNHAEWLVRQVLRGTIAPAEAFRRLVGAIRRRGVRESAQLLVSGLTRQIQRKK
jgi:hypothetical protein